MTKMIICKKCGRYMPHCAHGLCDTCRKNMWRYQNGLNTPMSENKSCAMYLGVYVAEQVLSKVFKDVKRMPYCNPGFDFICGKGYIIDVKSGCRVSYKNRDTWGFHIEKNKIPDYFLLLAFDNRDDLNPEHIWLIPGQILNDKIGTRISESRLDKWDEYKLDINKVIDCCNVMKDGN